MDTSPEMIETCTQKLHTWQQQQQQFQQGNNDTASGAVVHNTLNYKLVKVDVLLEPNRAVREATTTTSATPPTITPGSGSGKQGTTTFGPTIVIIDIGGNRDDAAVVQTLKWVLDSFGGRGDRNPNTPPLRLVLVKSRALVRAALSEGMAPATAAAAPSHNTKNKNTTKNTTTSVGLRVDPATGIMTNGTPWLTAVVERCPPPPLQQQQQRCRFKHPLKAPLVFSPKDDTTPICRYHK